MKNRKKNWPLLRLVILQPFLAIFLPNKYLSKNLDSDSHFEGLNICKSQLDQFLWHKSQFVLTSMFFNFGRKKTEKLSFKNGHFLTICGHFYGNYIDIFLKTEIQMVLLRCSVCLNLNWIKSYNIMLVKNIFFSCLKMHHFRAILPKWILTTLRKPAVIFSKQLFFQNSL